MSRDLRPQCVPEHSAPATTGLQVLVESLLELGVDTVSGYPGDAVLPLYDAMCTEPRLPHVLVRTRPDVSPASMPVRKGRGTRSLLPMK